MGIYNRSPSKAKLKFSRQQAAEVAIPMGAAPVSSAALWQQGIAVTQGKHQESQATVVKVTQFVLMSLLQAKANYSAGADCYHSGASLHLASFTSAEDLTQD